MSPSPSILLQGIIASGEFSAVYLCATNKALMVVKCFERARVSADKSLVRRVQNEKYILSLVSQLPHPFIVQLRFTHFDTDQMFLGMDYVAGCDAFTLLHHKGSLSPDWTRLYAAEVCLALGHLHSFDLIFRDLKPENVLIGVDGHTKLTDFGSALKMYGRLGLEPPPARAVSLGGTPEYMSPEVLTGAPTCEVSDWWSFGCFVTELLTGCSPFAGANMNLQGLTRQIIHDPIEVPYHPHVGASEVCFVESLLVREPIDRLGARPHGHTAVLAHKWFDGVSAESLLRKQLPAPWIPHLDGPLPEAEFDPEADVHAAESNAEASGHAQGALVDATDETIKAQLAEELALPPLLLDGWGERADVSVVRREFLDRDVIKMLTDSRAVRVKSE